MERGIFAEAHLVSATKGRLDSCLGISRQRGSFHHALPYLLGLDQEIDNTNIPFLASVLDSLWLSFSFFLENLHNLFYFH